MATTHTKPDTTFDAIYERATDASDQFAAAARKVGHAYLDSYDKAVDRAIDFELKVAETSKQDWLKGLIETQAQFAREVTNSYTATARSFLK